jgi:hypothetical protein
MVINPGAGSETTYAVLRVGRKVGRTVYLQAAPAPSDSDTLIGLMDSPVVAAAVVDAVNVAWQLTEWFADRLARDREDEEAAQWLEQLRPIWAAGWAPGTTPGAR